MHTSACLWARVHVCVTECPGWRREPTLGTLDRRYIPFFQSEGKHRQAPNDTRLVEEAGESTFSFPPSIPRLQVNPAVNLRAPLDAFRSFF